MKRYIRAGYIPDMTERYPEGMREVPERSDEYDAHDDLYSESNSNMFDYEPWDSFKGRAYQVVGATSNSFGEVTDNAAPLITDSSRAAIHAWFRINAKFPTETAILAKTKKDAFELITYAFEHLDWVMSLFDKYTCHYKPEYLKEAIIKKYEDKCKYFHESDFGDMIYPFDVG